MTVSTAELFYGIKSAYIYLVLLSSNVIAANICKLILVFIVHCLHSIEASFLQHQETFVLQNDLVF